MKRTNRFTAAARVILPLFAGVACAATVRAQPPGGPPPDGGPGGQGRPPFGGPPGGPGGMGAPRQASTADVPMPMLEAGLSLTADQKAQIAPIQRAFRSQRPPMPPPQGSPQDGPPDMTAMRAQMEQMRTAQQQASRKIEAILTPEQKQALPALLKELDALRVTGIPADLYGQLKLTGDQKTRIAAIAQKAQQKMRAGTGGGQPGGDPGAMRDAMQSRRQAHDDALAVLTPTQQQLVQSQRGNRPPGGPDGGPPPPGGFGGPGGPGGPPPGGGDGPPPPPPGGGDGPPPDGQNSPPSA